MPFLPKNFAHKKHAKGRLSLRQGQNQKIEFGDVAIKALQPGRLTDRQIESVRKTIKKIIKPTGGIIRRKLVLSVPLTQKSLVSRMGRGKGRVSFHVAPVRAGQILFEVYDPAFSLHKEALTHALMKLPLCSTLAVRRHV